MTDRQPRPPRATGPGAPRPMDCTEFVTLVTEYLEEAQVATERLRMDAHRAECDGCEAYLDQMIRTVDMLRRLADPGAGLSSEPTDPPRRTTI